ncbi:glycosyltransferase [Nesterenkonia pannonica]|uniref:glycosyltransferase n=1 Tax=Nesterenkonia pannonica TaxID=1548602 RepID=UPI002164ACD0|nr:glycosyltransferase [Nesterenkonia pannonica]
MLIAQRLEAEKDTATAIEAFARSELAARGWRLRIAGDGSLRPALERQAAELGIAQSTEFLGMRTDVSELMGAAGLMLAPCAVEGLGLGVLEAMSVGLPVVASRSGVISKPFRSRRTASASVPGMRRPRRQPSGSWQPTPKRAARWRSRDGSVSGRSSFPRRRRRGPKPCTGP